MAQSQDVRSYVPVDLVDQVCAGSQPGLCRISRNIAAERSERWQQQRTGSIGHSSKSWKYDYGAGGERKKGVDGATVSRVSSIDLLRSCFFILKYYDAEALRIKNN